MNLRHSVRAVILAAENISGSRWWSLADIACHRELELFSPRDLATPLAALIAGGSPTRPVLHDPAGHRPRAAATA